MPELKDLIKRAERAKERLSCSRGSFDAEVARLQEQLKAIGRNFDENRRLIDQQDRETRQLKKENEWLTVALKDLTEAIEGEAQETAVLTELANLVGELHGAVNGREAVETARSEVPTADLTVPSNAVADNGDETSTEAGEDPTIPKFLRQGVDWFQRA